jgi:predicted O-methyltransferase YrrM
MTFGGSGFLTIHTVQKHSEILALAQEVAELKPRIILEIGTARAGTLLIWTGLASDRVLTCDLFHSPAQIPLLEALPPPDSDCQVSLLTGDSHTPEFKQRIASALGSEKVDFLFIDGDHTEAGVEQDYEDYKEFVRPGGLIAFHDIVAKQAIPTNQVYPFWERVKQSRDYEEFIDDREQTGFGIGLLRVPPTSS